MSEDKKRVLGLLASIMLILSLLALSLSLSSCVPARPERRMRDYSYTIVDGMPCVAIGQTIASCDWEQWDGRVVDGNVVIGELR